MIDWIDLLNEHAEWTGEKSLIDWFSNLKGEQTSLDKNSIEDKKSIDLFLEQLSFVRAQLCALHFDEPVDTKSLAQKLQVLQIDFGYLLACSKNYGQSNDRDSNDRLSNEAVSRGRPPSQPLPLLHVRPKSDDDNGLLLAIADTALLQFAWFLSDALFSGNKNAIARCEGVYRVPLSEDSSLCATKVFNNEQENRFRQELPLLTNKEMIQDAEIQRCCDFFIAKPKARFCSDTCRYTTFQLTKQFEDPNYLAQKQKRYRSKQKSS
jgi:hypothetical protein